MYSQLITQAIGSRMSQERRETNILPKLYWTPVSEESRGSRKHAGIVDIVKETEELLKHLLSGLLVV